MAARRSEDDCIACGVQLSEDNWTPGKRRWSHKVCRSCVSVRQREYVSRKGRAEVNAINLRSRARSKVRDPKEHRLRRYASNLKSVYGITIHDYYAILLKQGGGCAICKTKEPGGMSIEMFHVDHDHATGRVRGLLCQQCNTGLGLFRDNLKLLYAAMGYLIDPPA